MSDYWEDRALALKASALGLAEEAEEKLVKEYVNAAEDTLKEYAKLIKPWKNEDGTYDVDGIKKAMRTDNDFRMKYQLLSKHLDDSLIKIAKNEQNIVRQVLIEIERNTETVLLNNSLTLLNEKAVEIAINTPWTSDGIVYSTRIWNNVNALKADMQNIMLDSVLKGQNPRKTAKRIMSKYGVGAHQAERLVRTETMAIYNKAAFESYQDLGVEQYEILGDPDDHMCEPSGTRHYMYEFDEGHTAPPYHPNCKCCIIPIVD